MRIDKVTSRPFKAVFFGYFGNKEKCEAATYHRSLSEAKKSARKRGGEVYERDPFFGELHNDCQFWKEIKNDHNT